VNPAFQADAEVCIGTAGNTLPPLAETRILRSLTFADCKNLTVLELNAPGILEKNCVEPEMLTVMAEVECDRDRFHAWNVKAHSQLHYSPVNKGFADAMLLSKQTSAAQIWFTGLQDLRGSHFDVAGAQVSHTHCRNTVDSTHITCHAVID